MPSDLTRTKLVKLLYLIDLSYANAKKRSLTGVKYYSYYHGPYSEKIIHAIEEMNGYEIEEYSSITADGRQYYMYMPGRNPRWKIPPVLDDEEVEIIDSVVSEHRHKSLDEILKYVYNTKPYKSCRKGQPIVLTPHA